MSNDPERQTLQTLVLATNNPGKVVELRRLLAGLPFDIVSARDALGRAFHVEETSDTFRGNATLKARAACEATGLLSVADDSGIEVDALGGRPGVRSARYAGEGASDAENNKRLLEELSGVSEPRRGARFRCAIALARPQGEVRVVEADCAGSILFAPRGTRGFGYDPLFWVHELGASFGELSAEEKDRVSHRGRALAKLRHLLEGSEA